MLYTFGKVVIMVNRIKQLRLEAGMEQKDLAQRLSCSQVSVSRYESGGRGLDVPTICTLCDIFGVTADYLLCRSDSRLPVVTESDAALLRAYHAASLRDRTLVDQILEAYAEALPSGKSVG